MTCSNYKELITGGTEALNRYKREKGNKECPKRRIAIVWEFAGTV